MAFVAVAGTVGAAVGLGGTAAIIGGGALIGAGVGGLYSAVTGDGDILNSMLTGGLIGGAGAYGLGAMGAGGAPVQSAMAGPFWGAPATGAGTIGPAATTVATSTPAMEAAALLDAAAVAEGSTTAGMATEYAAQEAAKTAAADLAKKEAAKSGMNMLGYGLAGTAGMQLLGNRNPKGAIAPASATDPGNIRPYEFSPNQMASGDFPSPYATAQYNAAGIPIMDTRERNYFDQKYTAQTPYSARSGTLNPNVPLPTSAIANAANGGIMRNYDDELGKDETSLDQGNMQKGLFGLGYAHGGIARFADKGMVDEEAELRKVVMNNLKRLSPDQLQNVMGFKDQKETEQQFLMKHMPNYAESMRPTISGMVEGAQYGDRMSKSFIDKARENAFKSGNDFQEPSQNYARITPTMVNPESGTYGGIASIGRQIDPNTRVNMMADLERTPYDRNAMESVRRVGAGVDRRIGKDANLSAYYEQDPMGRSKAGGVRYTQQFANGGSPNSGFLGYGQAEEQTVGRPNPVGEYLINSILGNPASPSAAVLGGGSSGTESSSSSSSSAESNPILRAMYDKQVENPDYQFTQPELVSGYQALNPNAFSYNQSAKRYSAANPNEQQLSSFKQQMADYMAQDRARKEQAAAAAAAQSMQSYDGGGGGANGGLMPYNLGGYSDGGRLLRGPGDGVSDDIPATIAGKQPARLADGEFVIPARIVSEIGNGSTDAGAKRLYAMMDRIQSGRKKTVGKGNIAKDTKAKKHLLA